MFGGERIWKVLGGFVGLRGDLDWKFGGEEGVWGFDLGEGDLGV